MLARIIEFLSTSPMVPWFLWCHFFNVAFFMLEWRSRLSAVSHAAMTAVVALGGSSLVSWMTGRIPAWFGDFGDVCFIYCFMTWGLVRILSPMRWQGPWVRLFRVVRALVASLATAARCRTILNSVDETVVLAAQQERVLNYGKGLWWASTDDAWLGPLLMGILAGTGGTLIFIIWLRLFKPNLLSDDGQRAMIQWPVQSALLISLSYLVLGRTATAYRTLVTISATHALLGTRLPGTLHTVGVWNRKRTLHVSAEKRSQ